MAYEKYKLKSETPQRRERPSGNPGRYPANRSTSNRNASGRSSANRSGGNRSSAGRRPSNAGNPNQGRRPRPAQGTGTIRNNMERYQTDRVSQAKKRQAPPSARAASGKESAAQIAQKHEKRKKWIIRLAILLVVLIICGLCFLFTFRVFYDVPLNAEDTNQVEITLSSNDVTDDEVAKLLIDAGCIDDARLYKIRAKIYEAKYVAGTYKVSPSFSTEKLVNILSGYDYTTEGVMEEE